MGRDLLGEFQTEHGFGLARTVETIGETEELRRVRDMPRRVWQDDPALPDLVRLLTAKLRHTNAPCKMPCEGCKATELRPAQAQLLREAYNGRGGIGSLRVGAGKRLLSFLLPTVLKARRPLLIVPGADKEDAPRLHAQYARHWRVAPVKIVTYEFLAHPTRKDWLAEYKPDLIVADESHKLSRGSIVSRRVGLYVRATGCVLVPLTGTLAGRSILAYWHYAHWAMPGRAPLPRKLDEAQVWAQALDEKVLDEARPEPGALLQLGSYPAEAEPLVQARRAYQDRFTSTPGVVSTLEDIPSVGLTVRATVLELPAELAAAVKRMRKTWQTPAGEDFSDALTLFRHSITLGAGLFMRWDPAAPREWMDARREWHRFVRRVLSTSRRMDSIVHVAQAVDRGDLPDGGVLARWRALEPTFEPNPIPVWMDDTALKYAAAWLKQDRGIVWVAQVAAGERLSEMTGVPFFSSGACDRSGNHASTHDGPMIASVAACRERLNLQYSNWRNLFLTCPPKNTWIEQAVGRTHRDGQPKDDVSVEFLLTTRESFLCLKQCVRDAEMDWATHGQPQKLAYANRDLGPVEALLADPDMEVPGP